MSELRSEETVSETTLSLDKSCYCWRCGYEWVSRKRKVPPAICPRCRRDDWDIHRRFECRECGHVFRSADLTTFAYRLFPNCPNCQSSSWHKQIEDKLGDLYHQGNIAFSVEKWQMAIEKFAEILKIRPDLDAASKCEQARKAQEQARKAQEQAQEQATLSQLYQQGIEYFNAEKWSSALKKFKAIQRITPDYRDVCVKYQEARDAFRARAAARSAEREAKRKEEKAKYKEEEAKRKEEWERFWRHYAAEGHPFTKLTGKRKEK